TGNSPVCMNGTINLNALGGIGFSWSGPNGFFSNSASPSIPAATDLNEGSYGVVVTDMNGCSAPGSYSVSVVDPPTPFAGSNTPVCAGDNLLLNLSQPYAVYSWTGPNAFSSSVQNPQISQVTVAATGTYSVTVTDINNCVGSTSVTVVVNPIPTGTLVAVPARCAPLCDTLSFVPAVNNIVLYSWNLGVGTIDINNDSISHCFNQSGAYDVMLTLTDANSCSNTITELAWVNVYENPVADFVYAPNPITIFEPTAILFDASSGPAAQTVDWQIGNPVLGTSNLPSPTFTFPEVGVYDITYTIVSSQGCSSTVVKPLVVLEEFAVYIPNCFTPNGDGTNETFGPVGIGIDKEKYNLYIFDRWGELLFHSTEYGKNWDGKKMGHDGIVQEDVYIYKFECRKINGEKYTKSGHVTVVR
ncbi:MAG TPA: gliding motility-associated C-terminal domain-containing protein, partial [Bacteroidia bacterium]